jgi:hypothetical protein
VTGLDELERLRVRLVDVPGLDPVGLPARADADGRLGVYVPGGPEGCWVWHGEDVYDADVWCMSSVSTADASTRDRLARWVAARVFSALAGPDAECTAPAWGRWQAQVWELNSDIEDALQYFSGVNRPRRCHVVPALADLNADDPSLLPDGCRWVYAAALAEVVRHLGRTP